MVEPSQREVDEALESSMQMFERVQVGQVAPLEPHTPKHVLLALDASSQDETSLAVTRVLRERFAVGVSILAACDDPDRVAEAARRALGEATVIPSRGARDSFEQILTAIDTSRADLLVSPCPFGRDFEQIGPDSAGTVVDVLLARSPIPLLVVRQPHAISGAAFRQVALPLGGENRAAQDAAAWAAGLVAPGGHLELILVVEDEFRESARQLLESMRLEVPPGSEGLETALRKAHVRLHRALQKTAQQAGFDYALTVESEDEARAFLNRELSALSLVVVAVERPDHLSQGFANHCIRCSRQPVLVVPKG
jgi:hypothetical protein